MSMHVAFSGCHDGYQQSPQQQKQLQSPSETPKSFAALSSSSTEERDEIINKMEVSQLEKLKNEAKKMLIQYDENFQKQKGRLPTKGEKEPMRLFYDMYKNLRNETLRKEGHKRLVKLRIEKWELKEQLKEYDKIFAMSNGGRVPTASERGPIRNIYEKYTLTKDEIQRLEQTEEQAKIQQLMKLQKKEKSENAANVKWEKTYPKKQIHKRGGFEDVGAGTGGGPTVTFQATSSASSSSSHSSTTASSSTYTGYDDETPRGERVSKGEHEKIMQQSARKQQRAQRNKRLPRQPQMKQKEFVEKKKTYSIRSNHKNDDNNLSDNDGRDETRGPRQQQNRNPLYQGTQGFSSSVLMSTHSNYRFQKTPQHQQQQQQQHQQHIQSNDDEGRDPPPSSPVVTEPSSRAAIIGATTSATNKFNMKKKGMGNNSIMASTVSTTATSTTGGRSKFEEFGEIVVLGPKKEKKPKTKIQPKKEKSRKVKWEEGNAKRKVAMLKGASLYKQ